MRSRLLEHSASAGSSLICVPPPEAPVYRIGRSPDPFAVRPWHTAGEDGTFGKRFDDPGGRLGIPELERFRTIYCATQPIAAFGEVAARLRPSPKLLAELAEIDDEEETFEEAIAGVVDPEADIPPDPEAPWRGLITLDWQLKRRIGHAYIDPNLVFLDVDAAESMNHLRITFASLMVHLGVDDLDLSVVTSQNRELTQSIARYTYEQTDETGKPRFAGLRYISRLDRQWECWAIFDDRWQPERGPSESISPGDPHLLEIARIFRLTIEGPSKGHYTRP